MAPRLACLVGLGALAAPGLAGYDRDMGMSCYALPMGAGQTSCDPEYSVCVPSCLGGSWCKMPVPHAGTCRCKCSHQVEPGQTGEQPKSCVPIEGQDADTVAEQSRQQKLTGECEATPAPTSLSTTTEEEPGSGQAEVPGAAATQAAARPEVPCTCTAEWDPVCGVDGQTYSNPCAAGCGNATVAARGECPSTTSGALAAAAASTTTAGPSSSPATSSSQAGESDCVCTAEWDPVCGADGQTYGNPCAAGCEGAAIAHTGECPAAAAGAAEAGGAGEGDSSEADRPEDSTSEADQPEDTTSEADQPEDTTSGADQPEDTTSEASTTASPGKASTTAARQPTAPAAAGSPATASGAATAGDSAGATTSSEASTTAAPTTPTTSVAATTTMAADGSTAADEDAGAAAAGGTEPAPDEPTSTTAAAAAAAAAATTDEAGAAAAASDTPPPGVPFSAGAPGAAAETTAPAPAAGDCCEALEKECLACAADMPVDRFCQMNMGRYGCPESPAWASDLEREMMDIPQDGAEREMMDIPQETTSHTTGSNRCCEDLEDRRCLACVNRISVEELCDMFPNRYGCSNRGEVTAIVTDGAARLFAADGPQPRGSPAPPPPAVGAATALVPAVAAMAAAAAVARLHRCVAAPPERPPEAEAQGLIAVENEV